MRSSCCFFLLQPCVVRICSRAFGDLLSLGSLSLIAFHPNPACRRKSISRVSCSTSHSLVRLRVDGISVDLGENDRVRLRSFSSESRRHWCPRREQSDLFTPIDVQRGLWLSSVIVDGGWVRKPCSVSVIGSIDWPIVSSVAWRVTWLCHVELPLVSQQSGRRIDLAFGRMAMAKRNASRVENVRCAVCVGFPLRFCTCHVHPRCSSRGRPVEWRGLVFCPSFHRRRSVWGLWSFDDTVAVLGEAPSLQSES